MNYNIQYPLNPSDKGFLLNLTTNKREALRSNLLFFLKTEKGTRLFKPNFGLKLKQYLFDLSESNFIAIKDEITQGVQLNFTGITIEQIDIEVVDLAYNITVYYNYTDGVFTQSDVVIFNL